MPCYTCPSAQHSHANTQQCANRKTQTCEETPAAVIEEGANWLSVVESLGAVQDLEAWHQQTPLRIKIFSSLFQHAALSTGTNVQIGGLTVSTSV